MVAPIVLGELGLARYPCFQAFVHWIQLHLVLAQDDNPDLSIGSAAHS